MNKSRDEKAILRGQVEAELYSKKLCTYESYECSHLALENSKYCLKHILRDKYAPYKQCNYIYQNNGKRCHLPAPKHDKKDYGYCSEHALRDTLTRNKKNVKHPPPITAEYLLSNLTHYIRKPRNLNNAASDEDKSTIEDVEKKVLKVTDPFVDIDAASIHNDQCNEILEMCSESESDIEPSTFGTVWHDENADSSDNESVDSEDDDPLKHANVYTVEEVSKIAKDKLIRLQSLYIEQYKYLRYLLKEKKRKYLNSLKREKETCTNIYNQVKDNPIEQNLYKKLKLYNKYQRSYGTEAVLEKRLHDLRIKVSGSGLGVKSFNLHKCQFTEGGVKCGEKIIPLAKYCRKHILEDPMQVLFKPCGKKNGNVECNTPVEAIFDDSTCKLHMDIPPLRSYSQTRKESESDHDDMDFSTTYELPSNENVVKTELMDYSLPSYGKMELPSMLFEDSTESLPSTFQYSTSEFTEGIHEQNSVDISENSTGLIEINDSIKLEVIQEEEEEEKEAEKNDKDTELKVNGNNSGMDNSDLESLKLEISTDTDEVWDEK